MNKERMPQYCRDELMNIAGVRADREICGFIMKDWWVYDIENTAVSDREFYMNEEQLLHVMMNHREDVIGIYHSHPGGNLTPSRKDIEYAPNDMRYWIISPRGVVEWVIMNGVAQTAKVDSANMAE